MCTSHSGGLEPKSKASAETLVLKFSLATTLHTPPSFSGQRGSHDRRTRFDVNTLTESMYPNLENSTFGRKIPVLFKLFVLVQHDLVSLAIAPHAAKIYLSSIVVKLCKLRYWHGLFQGTDVRQ